MRKRDGFLTGINDIGKPVIGQQGNVYEGKFISKDLNFMNPVIFMRVDHSTIETPENYTSASILEETTKRVQYPCGFRCKSRRDCFI